MIFKKALFACAAAAALTSFAGAAAAAEANATAAAGAAAGEAAAENAAGTVGEVVVTARKTSENLQRIPVAVTAVSGAQLAEQRINEPTDLNKATPSLFIRASSSSQNSAQIALRGQYAADSLLGISQPVGMYEDTVNIPHPFGANNAFFDLARVEVLKGPQGTLYGRNTTAGAINIITRNADYSGIHGFLEGELGNYNDARIGGAINIPVIPEVLAARLSYQHWNRQGFAFSPVANQHFGDGLDSDLARLSVKFDPSPNFTATAKVEYGHNHNAGADLWNIALAPANLATPASSISTSLGVVSDALWSDYAKYAPLVLAGLRGDAAAASQVLAAGHALLDPCIGGNPYQNCSGLVQYDIVRTWHGVLDWTWRINDDVSLRGITGYHAFSNAKNGDLSAIQAQVLDIGYGLSPIGGYTPLAPQVVPPHGYMPLRPDTIDQADAQWSQEFNLTGKAFDNHIDWLAGFFYSTDTGHGSQPAGDLEELFPLLTLAGSGLTLAQQQALVTNPAANANPLYYSPPYFSHYSSKVGNSQWAVFTQDNFKFNDVFSLTFGARWTQEHIFQNLSNWNFHFDGSSASGGYFTCDNGDPNVHYPTEPDCSQIPGGVIPVGEPGAGRAFIGAAGPNGSWLAQSYGAFTYLVSLNVQFTPDTLGYFKVSRGFRGGAYGRANGFPAHPEYDQDYELGLKSDLFEHRLRVNLAMYESDITDKQVSALQCIGTTLPTGFCDSLGYTTVVLNAAKARNRGVELEAIAVPFKGLTVTANGSYDDSVYLDFPGATSGDGVPLGHLKNFPEAVSPTWQGDIQGRYEWPMFSGVMAIAGDVNYRGSIPITPLTHQNVFTTNPGPEKFMNRAVTLLNARIEFKLPDQGLTMSIWGTNLTNVVWGYQGISPNYTGGVAHMYLQDPLMFGGTIRKTFGGGD